MSARGHLRVLLGAAPGVGKTYTMLEEGHRLREEGRDVVVAVLETHGRRATAARAEGLETVPRRRLRHRGVELEEMDLEAVLARAPQVALVDELAHRCAPGSPHERRHEDVASLLDAGIDVLTTVNIQHIASLNDVVEEITGVPQQETVPDSLLRAADQVEVVDLDPQALRDRLSGGLVYPAERIDAALSNYFRLGNLTALRELALLWLADEVDQALIAYRDAQGIRRTWETRERVVVALTGGPEGETLLRRGARIAARSSGGELLAVHVGGQDGLRTWDPAALERQRALCESLGGGYHQVIGEDVPAALLDFARSVNATQLVMGASRRGALATVLTGPGIGASVVRAAGDIDVHMVPHAGAARGGPLPRIGGALSVRRRLLGLALALLGGPLLTAVMIPLRGPESITGEVLSYQLLVVLVALLGGLWPALLAAVLSGVTLDFFFIDPVRTVSIADPRHTLALGLYVVIAALVSLVVDRAARRTRAAQRSAAESELIQDIAGSVLRGGDAVEAVAERTARALRLEGLAVVEAGTSSGGSTGGTAGTVLAEVGSLAGGVTASLPLADGARLDWRGPDLPASERRLLAVAAAQLSTALEHQRLEETASDLAPLAASDKVRGALLSALGHDLRRPLAAARTAVGGLREAGHSLRPEERDELLATADQSLVALSSLLTDLLDVSRVEAGALEVRPRPCDPSEALAAALDELGMGPDRVDLDLGHEEELVLADPVLLRRAVVNLLANADRHGGAAGTIRVTTSVFGGRAEIRVIDHGPGIPAERLEAVFRPFQRLGDTDNTAGLGLGLALSRGVVESMGGALTPEDTPGGGLTMVISLPLAPPGGSPR